MARETCIVHQCKVRHTQRIVVQLPVFSEHFAYCVTQFGIRVTHDVRRVPAYTQRRVHIRGSVRIRERWVLVRSGRVYTPGCIYAGRCVYASGGCVYAAGAYTHQGAYTRVGAFTRVVGACTQRVHICTRVCIRGSVHIRERWVCIHRGCVYAPPRVYTGFCVYAPPTAFTQESTNRNDYEDRVQIH